MLPTKASNERRRRQRFPIECEIRFRLLDSRKHLPQQAGKTLNISSKGILFESPCELPIGKRVEISIAWPAALSHRCRLKMVTIGKLVRFENGRAAALIQKHEFRTQGALIN